MTLPQPSSQQQPGVLTIVQLIFSGLGVALSLLLAVLLFVAAAAGVMGETMRPIEAAPLLAMGWISLLVGALAVPSLFYSIRRARQQTLTQAISAPAGAQGGSFRLASILIVLWPLLLVVGRLVSRGPLDWLLLPLLQLFAIGLPLWWLVEAARRGLPAGSRQRGWGTLNFSIFITTPLMIVVESIVIIAIVIAAVILVSLQPDLVARLEEIGRDLMRGPQPDPQAVLELVRPYLQHPLVLFGIFALLAGLVPLIEELLKPLALWLLAGRRLTPHEGFVGGALCGAGFALIESLMNLATPPGESWALLIVGRAGTGLLHITTTALVGWALASAWSGGSYIRLGVTYLLSSTLHGLWNALSILTGINTLLQGAPNGLQGLARVGMIAPLGLGVLIFFLFLLLWGSSARLRKEVSSAPAGTAPAIEYTSPTRSIPPDTY